MKFNFFRRCLLLCFALAFSLGISAQIPKLISYQGFLTNNAGQALADGSYNVTIKIFDAASGGNELFSETHSVNLVNGIFNLAIGENTSLNLPFDRAYYVSTTIDGTELLPRTAMTASPYALNAPASTGTNGKAHALDAFGGAKVDVVFVDATGRVGINATPNSAIQLLLLSDPDALVGMSIINTYNDPNNAAIGLDVKATGNRTSGTGGVFTASETGVVGRVLRSASAPGEAVGVLGLTEGGSSARRTGVKGLSSGIMEAIGVYGLGSGNGDNYGVMGESYDNGVFDVGIYGKAHSFAPGVWAGYFEGNTYVENNLSFGIRNIGNPQNQGLLIDKFTGLSFLTESSKSSINTDISNGDLVFALESKLRIENNTTIIDLVDGEGNFPLETFGLRNGLYISIAEQTNSDNYFAYFQDSEGFQGAITGSTSFADLDLGARLGSFLTSIFVPKSNAPTTAKFELFPAVDEDWGSSTNTNKTSDINNADTNDFGSVISAFAGDRVDVGFLIEAVLLSIDVAENAVAFASSFGSVLDPEDIFSTGLDLVISGVNLGVFLGYAIAADGVSYNSGAGDYAEWLIRADSNEVISFGDIVGVRAGEISTKFEEADHYMAVSTAPAVIGNMQDKTREHLYEKVAFMGQVPVKVRGIVKKGDYIVPSGDGDGLGIAVNPAEMLAKDYHRIVGIAWEESDGKELFRMINTAVGINQNDLANMVNELQSRVNAIQLALKEVNPDFEVDLFQTSGERKTQVASNLGYTVSDSHVSKTQGLFAGQTFSNREEANNAIREAWKQTANVDLEQHSFLNYMLENPELAPQMIEHYTGAIQQLQDLAKQINQQSEKGE